MIPAVGAPGDHEGLTTAISNDASIHGSLESVFAVTAMLRASQTGRPVLQANVGCPL